MRDANQLRIKRGDRVRVEYSGQLKDTKASARRLGREIFEFTVGSQEVMPGINKAVIGMVEGERKQLTLAPKDAYGEFRPQLIREIPRTRFPSELVLKIGKRLTLIGVKSQRRRKATIMDLKPTTVVVDGNHELAGKTIEVEIQLLVRTPGACGNKRARDLGGEA